MYTNCYNKFGSSVFLFLCSFTRSTLRTGHVYYPSTMLASLSVINELMILIPPVAHGVDLDIVLVTNGSGGYDCSLLINLLYRDE